LFIHHFTGIIEEKVGKLNMNRKMDDMTKLNFLMIAFLVMIHGTLIVISLVVLSQIGSEDQNAIAAIFVALLCIAILISSGILFILTLILGLFRIKYYKKSIKSKGSFDSINIFQLVVGILSLFVSITAFMAMSRASMVAWANMLYGFMLAFSFTLIYITFKLNKQLRNDINQ
jgi:hypothetical protein